MIKAEGLVVHGALQGVDCALAPGEVLAVVGHNGSGKSTLARLLCGAQKPDSGFVEIDGYSTAVEAERAHVRRLVGYVGQNPIDQIVSTTVADEIAFGLRNIGREAEELKRLVARSLERVGLSGFASREVATLSGGEQQRLVLASVLAMEPRYVVFDEVTAQLDTAFRRSFRRMVRELATAGYGVVLITHDPLEVLLGNRVLALDAGCITWAGAPAALLLQKRDLWDRILPASAYIETLRAACDEGYDLDAGFEPVRLAVWAREDRRRAGKLMRVLHPGHGDGEALSRDRSAAVCGAWDGGITCDDVSVCIDGTSALSDVSFQVPTGTITLVAGPSGAGKTTLASTVAGLLAPDEGCVSICGSPPRPGEVALAFQNPEQQLFLETVEDELAFAPRNIGCDDGELTERVRRAAERLGVTDLLDRDPFCLSGGQARRVALASVLTAEPKSVVFDEPTAGLDAPSRTALHALVRNLAAGGLTVLVVSHDLEEWLGITDRVVLLNQGRLAWFGSPERLAEDTGAFARSGLEAPESWQLASMLCSAGSLSPALEMGHTGPVPEPLVSGGGPARLDVRVTLLLLLAATIAIFAAGSITVLAMWMLVAFLALHASGARMRDVARSIRPVLVLLIFIVCANLVSCDGSSDIVLAGPVGLSIDGAWRAATAIVRIVLMVCLALAVAASVTPTKLADACTALIGPLRRFGVPVDDVGLALSMALRFIPVVAEEASRIRLAQRARGVDFDGGSLAERIRAWASVLTPLVVGLFRRADHVAASMDARCYGQDGGVEPHLEPLERRDRAALVIGIVGMVALTILSYSIG